MKTIHLTPKQKENSLGYPLTAHIRPVHGKKIALPTLEGFLFKKVENIVLLEAQGNYTNLLFEDGSRIMVCKTLRHTEQMLQSYPQFIRIHRSFTINLNCLDRYVKGKGGYVILENGESISVSNGRKSHFMNALKYYFGYDGE
ncbi:MAG: LytTR family transcriptional regulator [Chitinophagales bacterium]|nr:LytTR family transcriptional regulator [Chitinophagales bacterium]